MDHFFTCPAKLPLRVIYIDIYIYIYRVAPKKTEQSIF